MNHLGRNVSGMCSQPQSSRKYCSCCRYWCQYIDVTSSSWPSIKNESVAGHTETKLTLCMCVVGWIYWERAVTCCRYDQPSVLRVFVHFITAVHLFWEASPLLSAPAALGGKALDGSPEVWRSALQEATVGIKACPSPTGPCAGQPELHLHIVIVFPSTEARRRHCSHQRLSTRSDMTVKPWESENIIMGW